MIVEIDGLKMPPSASSQAELFNNDTQKRTVSNRLITKISSNQKWRLMVLYDNDTLNMELQTKFYTKCIILRSAPKDVKFISPYDGQLKNVKAKLISLNTPTITKISNGVPKLYTQIGAVFEEI